MMAALVTIRGFLMTAAAAALLLVASGCEKSEGEGSTSAGAGGEATAGGEEDPSGFVGGTEENPMTVVEDAPSENSEGWDGDPQAGSSAGAAEGSSGAAGGAAADAQPEASPWGKTRAEQCRTEPRRSMSSSAQSAFQRGLRAVQQGDVSAAKSAFQQALSADRNAYKAAYNLGVLADRSGDTTRALEYYRRSLSIQPDYERAAEGIVTIYLRRGSVPDAVAFIEPLARRFESNKHLQALLAEVYVHGERYDRAWEAARRALKCDERFVPAMIALIKSSLKQGRKELAQSILDQALGVNDNVAELHYLKAQLLLEEGGRLREAMSELERAVQLRPDYLEARMALGVQMLAGANYDAALKHFQVAAALAPQLVAVHLNLGDAYRATKQWAKAKAEFDRALSMEPQLPEAHFNMALMYMAAGEEFPGIDSLQAMQKAVEEFQRYRDMMGPRLPRDDPAEAYLTDLNRQIDREKRRRERDAERAARQAAQGGDASGGEGDQ